MAPDKNNLPRIGLGNPDRPGTYGRRHRCRRRGLAAATVGGANFGLVLLWAIVIGAFFKYVLTEGVARWQLATNTTLLEGWGAQLPDGSRHTSAPT